MDIANNPAGRLHALLTAAQKSSGKAALLKVWSEVLGVPQENRFELLAKLAEVLKLPEQVVLAVTKRVAPEDLPMFMTWRPGVEAAFMRFDLASSWSNINQHLTADAMLSLLHCHRELREASAEPTAQLEALQSLEKDVIELADETRRASIDPALRAFVLEHLAAIASALTNARVNGAGPIRTAAMTAVGDIVTSPVASVQLKRTAIGKRFLTFLRGLLLATSVANEFYELSEHVSKLLDSGDEAIEADVLAEPPVAEDENVA